MLESLLTRGFLPREVPPLFSSMSLKETIGKAMPPSFTGAKAKWTQPAQHNLARPGGLRRKLTIPNPVNFYRLANAFVNNWQLLHDKWSMSPYSKTTPDPKGPRAFANSSADRATPRARIRVGARYLVIADISQFYPSIYSHSIPWALHTKKVAKAEIKNPALPGNILDKEFQACFFGQTKGIAIGPDTSLGIAELLLSPLDLRLKEECKILGGVRFIDDMEYSFQKLSDAEAALALLESHLSEYEVQLNVGKTRIIALPDELESVHVTNLRPHIPESISAPPSSWIDFFNRAMVAAKMQPSAGVLRYAVGALKTVVVSERSWSLAQSLLWQCISIDPGCLRFVVDVLLVNKNIGREIDIEVASVAVNSLIQTSAPVGHGSEVVWSIWAAMLIGLQVDLESQEAVAAMDDCLVACIATVACERRVFAGTFTSPLWASWIVNDSFNQDHWMFVYEALRRGWYANEVKAAKLSDDVDAAFLIDADVTFIDSDMIDTYSPAGVMMLWYSGGAGDY
jgi:hypothetical protein